MSQSDLMDKIVSLAKRRGFIFQSSEIYGGLANAWDYGPLGVELKRNVKEAWWRSVVHHRDDMVGLDAAILMHPRAWEASGHVGNFSDEVVDCKQCNKRLRPDHIDGKCPYCGSTDFTDPSQFNLMLETQLGAKGDTSTKAYMRPETAQGIFVNFQNVVQATSRKLPFGIAQIGKSFRNEVTAGNFTFRMREFEQMEIEYFTTPETAEEAYQAWIETRFQWYKDLGINPDHLQLRKHGDDELAHYAKGCTDVEYKFPFGWSELEGIANRSDYDLKQHAEFSGKDLAYNDQVNNKKFYPHVIEPSGGCDRATLAFLVDAYQEEDLGEGKSRVVLKFHHDLAPIKVAVLPLLKKNADIVATCHAIKKDLQQDFMTMYNDTAAIGKLYRRQDEVGTPFCVTVDVDSLDDKCVTVRDRDTMAQERVAMDQLKQYLKEKMAQV